MTDTPFISPDFSSAEAQRQWYLRQLGISSYYPRVALPGALPSQIFELPGAAAAVRVAASAVQPRQPNQPAPAATGSDRAGAVRRALFDAGTTQPLGASPPQAPARPRVQSAPDTAAAAATVTGEAPRFRLLLLRAERGLAICNQIPLQGSEALAVQEQRLLQNMLVWLGTGLTDARPRAFLWPPRGLQGGSSDTADLAARSVFGFLEQAQQEQGFTRLLWMGSTGPELLQAWQQATDAALPWQAFRTHSLGEMLAQPLLKREAWQALQPLHRLLHAN